MSLKDYIGVSDVEKIAEVWISQLFFFFVVTHPRMAAAAIEFLFVILNGVCKHVILVLKNS